MYSNYNSNTYITTFSLNLPPEERRAKEGNLPKFTTRGEKSKGRKPNPNPN
jgi:hypothetical protein